MASSFTITNTQVFISDINQNRYEFKLKKFIENNDINKPIFINCNTTKCRNY